MGDSECPILNLGYAQDRYVISAYHREEREEMHQSSNIDNFIDTHLLPIT